MYRLRRQYLRLGWSRQMSWKINQSCLEPQQMCNHSTVTCALATRSAFGARASMSSHIMRPSCKAATLSTGRLDSRRTELTQLRYTCIQDNPCLLMGKNAVIKTSAIIKAIHNSCSWTAVLAIGQYKMCECVSVWTIRYLCLHFEIDRSASVGTGEHE